MVFESDNQWCSSLVINGVKVMPSKQFKSGKGHASIASEANFDGDPGSPSGGKRHCGWRASKSTSEALTLK
jgi:hypothetical protein